jgi:hypothetical protein
LIVTVACEALRGALSTQLALPPDSVVDVPSALVTVVVQESNEAAKANNTKTSTKTGISSTISSFLFGPGASGLLTKGGQFPSLKLEGKSDFTGGGKINVVVDYMGSATPPPDDSIPVRPLRSLPTRA